MHARVRPVQQGGPLCMIASGAHYLLIGPTIASTVGDHPTARGLGKPSQRLHRSSAFLHGVEQAGDVSDVLVSAP
jgi:hypothetical protein